MEDIRRLIRNLSDNLHEGKAAPDFWGLVRKLDKSRPDLPRVGRAKRPMEENIRFGQIPSLSFPPSDIAEIAEGGGNIDAAIMVYFFGLLGANGPMPHDFTSYIFQRSHNYNDNTWRRFLDIIHHRMLTLYYRAFSINQQAISFDFSADDAITDIIKSLLGMPPDVEIDEKIACIPPAHASNFGFMVKNEAGLEDILYRMFKIDLEVKGFITASYDMPPESYAILGNPKTAVLGRNIQIGRQYVSAAHKFEIRVGPIHFDVYKGLMPGTRGFELLTDTINLYLDRPLEYDLIVKFKSATIPKLQLGSSTIRLGYCTWVGSFVTDEIVLTIKASRLCRVRHSESYKNAGGTKWQN
ncbi:MAG: type VI secretion system baseplate subunit TssG [Treponema sp.]|jgi:type VI secretion system protein ImpH|nr:type VI secretion system baseplate subunit TssG [Treponema sp.]